MTLEWKTAAALIGFVTWALLVGFAPATEGAGEHLGQEQVRAGDIHDNLQLLGNLTKQRLDLSMRVYAAGLGVECTHCHVQLEWELDDVVSKGIARDMIRMVAEFPEGHFDGLRAPSCWTCHRGSVAPEINPDDETLSALRPNPPAIPEPDPFSTEARPAGEVYENIQQYTEVPANQLRSVMQAYSTSLGVGCDHCHEVGDWASDEIYTKTVARRMFVILAGIEEQFFDGRQVLSCWTCHRGQEGTPRIMPPPDLLPPE